MNRSVFCTFQKHLTASVFVLSLAVAALPAWCQEVTGAIRGTVTDPSGAAVAGAKVTAKDTERNSVFPTTTNSDGAYALPRLPVGHYSLRVEQTALSSGSTRRH